MSVRRRPAEIVVGIWGAIAFGALLASYAAFRPVRDALVLDGDPDQIPWLFTATFVAVSVVSPLWSALQSRGARSPGATAACPHRRDATAGGPAGEDLAGPPPATDRRRLVTSAFHVFALCGIGFAVLVGAGVAPIAVGRVFYVWASVFNLFLVSVFWSLLADLLGPELAKRLYGPIAAGGTIGAIAGPALTRALVGSIGVAGVLAMSAALLELAAFAVRQLRQHGARLERAPDEPVDAVDDGASRGALRGLAGVARSPYLLAICAYVLCTATAATFMYLEQASLAHATLPGRTARTALFATIDLWTSGITFVVQTLIAGSLLRRIGPGLVLGALPLAQGIGISVLAFAPSLTALIVVQVATRAATHGLTRPARELLFTVVSRDDKYRAKNVIDTMVYRFGDFGSAWLHAGLVGLGAGSLALVAAMGPLVAVWLGLATVLGAGFRRRAVALPTFEPNAVTSKEPT